LKSRILSLVDRKHGQCACPKACEAPESVFVNIALITGGEFNKYLKEVLNVIQQASTFQIKKSNFNMMHYLNDLKEGCWEGKSIIWQRLKGD
jgi:importin subunit beta-1